MNNKPKTLQEAIQHFNDEQVCIDTVASMRWPKGVSCPACEGKEHYYLASQKRWKCKECNRQFSVKLGTIFEDSPIALSKWMLAMWMLANCKNGVSSYEIAKAIGITQKSAWFMLHRIRFAMKSGSITTKKGGNGSEFEVDETFVGGNLRKMHAKRRALWQNKRGAVGKTAVMGILERGGKVHAKVIAGARRNILQPAVRELVESGSTVYTDEAVAYYGLQSDYTHAVINHLRGYVDGQVHTNGIENFWSLLKRQLGGTYVAVEPFHLDRYVDEQVWRYNFRKDEATNRKLTDSERFNIALSGIAGKRLTYAEVTGKNDPTSPQQAV
jgi:transposase-like protein